MAAEVQKRSKLEQQMAEEVKANDTLREQIVTALDDNRFLHANVSPYRYAGRRADISINVILQFLDPLAFWGTQMMCWHQIA